MKYYISNFKNCYICLNEINYYHKFNCNCFQYIHDDCFFNLNKCIICKNDNTLIYYDIQLLLFINNFNLIFNNKFSYYIIYFFKFLSYLPFFKN